MNPRVIRRYGYSDSDLLLLANPRAFPRMPYTGELWKAWTRLRALLMLIPDGSPIPGHWSIGDSLRCLKETASLSNELILSITTLWGRMGVRKIQDLWSQNLRSWTDFSPRFARLRNSDAGITMHAMTLMAAVKDSRIDPPGPAPNAALWRWVDRDERLKSFALQNARRYQLLRPKTVNHDRLNRIWRCSLTEEDWSSLWVKLWSSDLSSRAKIFTWRCLAQGLFSGARAARIGVADGSCHLCPEILETLPHTFISCSHVVNCWQICNTAFPALVHMSQGGLIEALGSLTTKNERSSLSFFLIYQILWLLWTGRNDQIFGGGSERSFDIFALYSETVDHVNAVLRSSVAGRKTARLTATLCLLHKLKAAWPRNMSFRISSV